MDHGPITYLDHAASTPVSDEVLEAMLPHLSGAYGNASARHGMGRRARQALEDAREHVARAIGARAEEVVFTSGGTESNNLALRGIARATLAERGTAHLVTSAVEHPSIRATAADLATSGGVSVTFVAVDALGRVSTDAVLASVRPETALVSVMLANNEVGTLQPVAEIAGALGGSGIALHTDAAQVPLWAELDVTRLGVDLMSLSGHKVGAPKGIGALFVRRGTSATAILTGGGQERGLRAGTENVAGAVGLGVALRWAAARRCETVARVAGLARGLSESLSALPGVVVTGDPSARLPNLVSVAVHGARADTLLVGLDLAGICASSGSACRAGGAEPSRVLLAMGLSPDAARGALRLSLGAGSTEADVERVLAVLPPLIERARAAGVPGAG